LGKNLSERGVDQRKKVASFAGIKESWEMPQDGEPLKNGSLPGKKETAFRKLVVEEEGLFPKTFR